MRYFSRFLLIALTLAVCLSLSAQNYLVKPPDALKNYDRLTINVIFQDPRGVLWLGTDEGLIRYDGASQRLYTTRDNLSDNRVTAIAADTSGDYRLIVGHGNGSLSMYDGMRFEKFKPKNEKEGTPTKQITDIQVDQAGQIWMTTDSIGLWVYQKNERMFMYGEDDGLLPPRDTTAKTETTELADEDLSDFADLLPELEGAGGLGKRKVEIYCAHIDENGVVWLGTDNGLVVFDPAKAEDERFSYITNEDGLPDNIVKKILPDKNGNLWLGLADAGLCRYMKNAKKFQEFPGWIYGQVNTIETSLSGDIWIGTNYNGVYRFNHNTQKYTPLDGVYAPTVVSLKEDARGNLFIGTREGVYQFYGERLALIDGSFNLPSTNTLSILVDKSGRIWTGTEKGLAVGLPDSSGKVTFRPFPLPGSVEPQVVALAEDRFGRIWAGAFLYGAYQIDPSTMQARRFYMNNGLPSNDIFDIVAAKNTIYMGTQGMGLAALPLDAAGRPGAVKMYGPEEGLIGNYIYCLFQDSKGAIWIGSDGKGLIKFDGANFTNYGEKEGLNARTIYSITEDGAGRIWLATAGQGVVEFDGKTFKEYRFSSQENSLRDDAPLSVVFAPPHYLVVGTKFGIDRLDLKSKKFSYYGEEDGIAGYEAQQGAIFRDKDGNIWVGATKGAIKYDPDAATPAETPPRLSFGQFFIDRELRKMRANSEYGYNENYMTFNYEGINLTAPGKVRYRYFMENFDREWSPWSRLDNHIYSNLPPGEYVFKVQATNGDGKMSEIAYPFVINPPLWQEPWFLLLSAILLIGGTVLAVRLRVRQIERDKKLLQQRVDEATRDIQEQKEIIEEKNKDITESIEYARRLQFAILPEIEVVKSYLPNSFIYYQPKDIVSGDFYWFHADGNKVMIAAVDCTGHGVPGAFMSVMGYNQLNEVVKLVDDYDPAMMLTLLDRRVVEALRQNTEYSVTKDGMDMALALIDFDKNELSYSGAYRPIYLVRNGEFVEHKGDRYPVGGAQEDLKSFETFKVPLEPGDKFYIFSDGYVDQFGGERERKFTPKRLKRLIDEHHTKSMEEQKTIYKGALEDWMANTDQLDDILLIGVEFAKTKSHSN